TYGRYVTGGAENWCGYSNPEIDRLMAEATREFDEKKRWDIVRRIQLLLLEELPSVPFAETLSLSLNHPYIHNWRNFGSAIGYVWFPTAELIWVDKR
ncbi:MAG: hypothetical protein HYY05_01400, partial [Chloroflexi bacterium]|nr:hypothetical protein [Chloroflexota bacterium]